MSATEYRGGSDGAQIPLTRYPPGQSNTLSCRGSGRGARDGPPGGQRLIPGDLPETPDQTLEDLTRGHTQNTNNDPTPTCGPNISKVTPEKQHDIQILDPMLDPSFVGSCGTLLDS